MHDVPTDRWPTSRFGVSQDPHFAASRSNYLWVWGGTGQVCLTHSPPTGICEETRHVWGHGNISGSRPIICITRGGNLPSVIPIRNPSLHVSLPNSPTPPTPATSHTPHRMISETFYVFLIFTNHLLTDLTNPKPTLTHGSIHAEDSWPVIPRGEHTVQLRVNGENGK